MFLDGDDTLSILPGLLDKLMKVGDQTREDKLCSSASAARSWGQKHFQYGDSIPFTHGFSASWVNFSRFSVIASGLSGHCARGQFLHADDVTVKKYAQVDQGWVQGPHCAEGGWRIHSETYLEG